MGRPKLYSTLAQKQAAYRAHLEATMAVVDRQALDHLQQRLDDLQRAVFLAAYRGDPLVRRCVATSVETVLEKVTAAFEERQECSEKGT